jgi:hypothetical protein
MFLQIPPDNLLSIPMEKKQEMSEVDFSDVICVIDKGKVKLSYIPWLESKRLLEIHFPNYRVMYETFPRVSNAGDPHPCMVGWADYGKAGCAVYPYILDTITGKRTMSMFFPVMDFRHNAAIDPSVMDLNTAFARAASKVVAVETWIGIQVYRKEKEDIPEDTKPLTETKASFSSRYAAPPQPPIVDPVAPTSKQPAPSSAVSKIKQLMKTESKFEALKSKSSPEPFDTEESSSMPF